MATIAAIGGGELRLGETFELDRGIVELTGKKDPRVLFIPTASGDPESYCACFSDVYGRQLGCLTDELLLVRKEPSASEIEDKILSADLIYVGGGNTGTMLSVWRERGVDRLLAEAYRKGTVLSGLSAGSICWFRHGQSEIDSDDSPDGFEYTVLEGLGLIPAFHCPHYNEGRRAEEFFRMMREHPDPGVAIDNGAALFIRDGEYRIVSAREDAFVHMLYAIDGEVTIEKLAPTACWKNAKDLLHYRR